jgi:hypothetical protein
MRCALGGCGQNFLFFTLRKTNTRSSIGEECSTVLGTLHRVVPRQ